MAAPTVTKISESTAQTKWRVQFPSTLAKQGATYIATTYPDSDLVFVQTAATLRKCNNERVKEAIRKLLAIK
jgi:hypothetical protein